MAVKDIVQIPDFAKSMYSQGVEPDITNLPETGFKAGDVISSGQVNTFIRMFNEGLKGLLSAFYKESSNQTDILNRELTAEKIQGYLLKGLKGIISDEILDLQNKITALQNKNSELETKYNELKAEIDEINGTLVDNNLLSSYSDDNAVYEYVKDKGWIITKIKSVNFFIITGTVYKLPESVSMYGRSVPIKGVITSIDDEPISIPDASGLVIPSTYSVESRLYITEGFKGIVYQPLWVDNSKDSDGVKVNYFPYVALCRTYNSMLQKYLPKSNLPYKKIVYTNTYTTNTENTILMGVSFFTDINIQLPKYLSVEEGDSVNNSYGIIDSSTSSSSFSVTISIPKEIHMVYISGGNFTNIKFNSDATSKPSLWTVPSGINMTWGVPLTNLPS